MIKLHVRIGECRDGDPFIARIARAGAPCSPDAEREVLLVGRGEALVPGYRAYLVVDDALPPNPNTWHLPEPLHHLSDGDIVRISPRAGALWVMYRRASAFNAMLLTEQCNSYCLMCSQPPKAGEDRYLVRAFIEAIPLMSPETHELGITGGEPTLLGDDLLEVIRTCKEHLPATALHVLSNGRLFQYLSLCRALAAIEHPDLMIGIPLYADLAHRHDFVVQADGAFDQTVRGLMNLARCGVSVELRMVLHRETVDRLPQFARFVARNLPFADHVALMGLELMGFVRMNLEALWIDPFDYQEPLRQAVEHLQRHGLHVSIYNLPLCVLDRRLWPVARQSISDWKNEFRDECTRCAVQDRCGGFFASSSLRCSAHVRPVPPESVASENPVIAQSTLPV